MALKSIQPAKIIHKSTNRFSYKTGALTASGVFAGSLAIVELENHFFTPLISCKF